MNNAKKLAKIVLSRIVITMLTLITGNASAGSTSTTLTVEANVVASCTISDGTIAFGPYDPIVANSGANDLTQTGTFNIICTSGVDAQISLGDGEHNSGGQRSMISGTSTLNYNLYQDPGFNNTWDTSSTLPYSGIGTSETIYVYGVIPANQTEATAGSYSDTVLITATF